MSYSYRPTAVLPDHYNSSKARFRPGKRPLQLERMSSLPSPPAEHGQLSDDDTAGDVDMIHTDVEDDDDEVDQLASDVDEEQGLGRRHHAGLKLFPAPCLLGSPANFLGGPAGTAISASRKHLLNPFLPNAAPNGAAASTSTAITGAALQPFPGAPLSPSSSPVRPPRQNASPSRRRHRSDPDRIKFDAAVLTPPSKSRELALVDEQIEAKRRAMGWYDEDNPFVDRNDDMAKRMQKKEPVHRPETVTWVKRGQRVATTIPFSALLTSDSPSDDPFTFTAPKLLFPPQTPPSLTPADLPATPARQSRFLEALKAAGGGGAAGAHAAGSADLPPTPATLKRRGGQMAGAGAALDERTSPAKRLRTTSGVGALGEQGSLHAHRGLR